MSESSVLRSSASPKNASPHMAGGKNHVQVAPKPMVQVTMTNGGPIPPSQKDKNVVLGRSPQRALPQPQTQAHGRAQVATGQLARDVDGAAAVSGGGVGAPAAGGGAKPMLQIRMDNGKPTAENGRNVGNRGNTVLLGGANGQSRQIARRQGANLPPNRAVNRGRALPAGAGVQVAAASAPNLTADQLMCCRHAVNQYLKSDQVNEMTADLAKSTLAGIDIELAARAGAAPAVVEPIAEEVLEVEAAQPTRQITVGGSGRSAGVSAPKRFSNRTFSGAPAATVPVRRVVPPPTPHDIPGFGAPPADEADATPEDTNTSDVTSGVIDVESSTVE